MKKVAILTSGGDAPGMNACVRACVRYAIYNGFEVYGVERGYVGLLEEGGIKELNSRSVADIIHRGGTVLKTARCVEFKDPEVVKKAAQNLKNMGIENLIVIGGDGSFRGAKDLSDLGGINVVGIPGTIDNDLAYTDFTLGFDTAVNTVISAINNLRDTMTSHDRVFLLEVMGRNCGDIAVYASIAGGAEHCLVPEVPFKIEDVAQSIINAQKRGKMSNMIICAEGVVNKDEICDKIKQLTGIGVKMTTLGHVQRGGSPTVTDRVLAAKMAVKAVDVIKEGKTNRVVGIKNNIINDMGITEALSMPRTFNKELYEIAHILAL